MRFFRILLATGWSSIGLAACSVGSTFVPPPAAGLGQSPAQESRLATASLAAERPAIANVSVFTAPAAADGTPDVAGTYDGTIAITRGGRTENGTLKVVIKQTGADISGTNVVDVPTLKTTGTETGTVARSTAGIAVTIAFADRKGLGTGTADGELVDGTLTATDVKFYVYKRPTGTVSFTVKKT